MKKSLSEYRLDFLDYLHHFRGYSETTLKSYDIAIKQMLQYAEIDQERGYINLMAYRLKIASQKSATIAKKLSAIRSFVRYLHEQGETVELEHDDSIKVAKKLPKPISDDKIKEAVAIADDFERLIVMLLYGLGLRISELSDIKLSDIKPGWIRIEGKGSKQRDIPIVKPLYQLIEAHIELNQPKRYLFENSESKLSENSLRYTITKLFKRVGLKVTPHQLRHSFASTLLNHDARIADVSELLGHTSMATTQIYTKLSNRLKMENYLKSHPLCKGDDEAF